MFFDFLILGFLSTSLGETNKVTWETAENYCNEFAGNSISFTNENDFKLGGKFMAVIGLNHYNLTGLRHVNGSWSFSDGANANFTRHELMLLERKRVEKTCLAIRSTGESRPYHDELMCAALKHFICQFCDNAFTHSKYSCWGPHVRINVHPAK